MRTNVLRRGPLLTLLSLIVLISGLLNGCQNNPPPAAAADSSEATSAPGAHQVNPAAAKAGEEASEKHRAELAAKRAQQSAKP